MNKQIQIEPESWIERKFEFNHPIGAFPAILERVRGTPARLEEMVRSFPQDILAVRAGDAWSIQEHVGHLYDLDELHEGRLEDYDANLEALRPADMTNKKTYDADHNKAHIDDLLARFRAARAQFVQRLDQMDEEMIARSALHPRLQKQMRVLDLALFVAEHDDHHLANIRHIARTLQTPPKDRY